MQRDTRQQIAEHLPPSFGLHRKQGAPGKTLQELVERQQGLLLAVIELQIRQRLDGQIVLTGITGGSGLLQPHRAILA